MHTSMERTDVPELNLLITAVIALEQETLTVDKSRESRKFKTPVAHKSRTEAIIESELQKSQELLAQLANHCM